MKAGCLFLLVLWIASGASYYFLLQGTAFADQYWLPIALSLSVVFFAANFYGIILAFAQARASKKSPQEWRDGEFVGTSGRVQALKSALTAPFSGKSAVIVEYEITHKSERSDSDTKIMDAVGMLMTPCAVYTSRGPIKLVGFPVITQIPKNTLKDKEAYQRAAKYLATTKFEERPKNVLSGLKEIDKILNDDDGDLKVNLKPKGSLGFDLNLAEEYRGDLEEHGHEDAFSPSTLAGIEEHTFTLLAERDCTLTEILVPNGVEVTVFGSYRANRQAIDIGSGLKNLKHQIHLGNLSATLAKQFRRAIIGSIIFGAICVAANWYVAKELGYPVESLLDKLKF